MAITHSLLALAALGLSLAVQAADAPPPIETRHGAIAMSAQPIAVEGGFTAVLQAADDRAIEPELGASFDLVTTLPAGTGKWVIYIEGNTSPLQRWGIQPAGRDQCRCRLGPGPGWQRPPAGLRGPLLPPD